LTSALCQGPETTSAAVVGAVCALMTTMRPSHDRNPGFGPLLQTVLSTYCDGPHSTDAVPKVVRLLLDLLMASPKVVDLVSGVASGGA
jgi:hypothetical protein